MPDTISQMLPALNDEIDALKKRGGSNSFELRGGECTGTTEGQYLYAFPFDGEITATDDSPVRIVAGNEEADGTVVSTGEGIITIALDRDLGPTIAMARVVLDDSFLIARLKDRLEEAQAGKVPIFDPIPADRVLGLATSKSGYIQPDPRLTADPGGDLNDEQRRAVGRALASETVYLWGPPGTGKTKTLASIVDAYYRAGKSVLLVSNTNIAVDTALQVVAERLRHEPGFHEGTVLRLGKIASADLATEFGEFVVLENVVERLSRELSTEKDSVQRQLSAAESEAAAVRSMLSLWQKVDVAESDLEDLRVRQQGLRARADEIEYRATDLTRRIEFVRQDLARAYSASSLRRLLTGLNPEKLAHRLSTLQSELTTTRASQEESGEESKRLAREFDEATQRVQSCREATLGQPERRTCVEQSASIEATIAQHGAALSVINAQLERVRVDVLSRCRVLATTVYRTYLKGQVERKFDAVVIDEASMLPLPMVYFAAGMAKEHVVVTGDFRQLPPIVAADTEAGREWLKTDVFRKAGIASAVAESRSPESLVALNKQYRMAPAICGLVNHFFYSDHPLETVTSRPPMDPFGSARLVFVDTSNLQPWSSMRLGTFSRYNLLHAMIVRNIVASLHERGFVSDGGTVGGTSPFAAQTRLILKMVDEHVGAKASQSIATVHRFQGGEKDVVVFDFTDSDGTRPSRFAQARHQDEDGARLLNVALSRARSALVFVANFDYIRRRLAGTLAEQIIDYLEENGESLAVNDVLPLSAEAWTDALGALPSPAFHFDSDSSGIFGAGTFYPAFRQDLDGAERSIVIFSPFLTGRGTSQWIDHLRAALARGVRIRIVTRPPGNQGGSLEQGLAERIESLKALGLSIDLRHQVHEKFAIVDSKILWHGSLNILSHNNTTESMLRIPSAKSCLQVQRFARSPKPGQRTSDDDDPGDLTSPENPPCGACGQATVWKNGRFGVWFECSEPSCTWKQSARSGRTNSATTQPPIAPGRQEPCPECGGTLVPRRGRYGMFMGCRSYPRCRFTKNITA